MKRWIALAAALYPRSWRREYGEEFDSLLDDVKPGWRVFANVLGGAIRMQMTTGKTWLKLATAMAAAGAIVAGGVSYTVPPHYVSSAVVSVTPQPDPVRPVSPQALRQRTAARVAEIETEILSRTSLSQIVNKLDLYKMERQREPFEDVFQLMRSNIRIQPVSSPDTGSAPIVFSISFDYPDQVKVQAAVRELAEKFTYANGVVNRTREEVYRSFWHDEDAAAVFYHRKPVPVPPPPVGDIIAVLNPASLPREPVPPNRYAFVIWGLAVGLLLGLVAAVAMGRPHGVWKLGGFAAAGCILAGAASFLIPDRFTSTAVMMIAPAVLTEDPLATPPAVTPATEFLRQTEPQVLSVQSLAKIIQERRLNLYPEERATMPMEEVVRNMLSRDLRISVLSPVSGASGAVPAFSISFSYSDRKKAHDVVQEVLMAFMDANLNAKRASASQSVTLSEIRQRKADENLDVLDPPTLPVSHETPNRLLIAAAGLGIGLLAGVIRLSLRRPYIPTPQPA